MRRRKNELVVLEKSRVRELAETVGFMNYCIGVGIAALSLLLFRGAYSSVGFITSFLIFMAVSMLVKYLRDEWVRNRFAELGVEA